MTTKHITYNEYQLEQTAYLVFTHNKGLRATWELYSIEETRQEILANAMRWAQSNLDVMESGNTDDWARTVSTGGFIVDFSTDDNITLNMEFYFDPSLIGSGDKNINTFQWKQITVEQE